MNKIVKVRTHRYKTTDGREHINESAAIEHQAHLELSNLFRASVITSTTVASELLKRRTDIAKLLKKADSSIARAKMREGRAIIMKNS